MKRNIIFLLLCLFVKASFAQNQYYDAIELRKLISPLSGKFDGSDEANLEKVGNILYKYYEKQIIPPPTYAKIKAIIESGSATENPFLSKYLPTSGSGVNALKDNKSFSFASIGSTNVTNFADGLAKFLVERSKEELNVAFFRKFQEFLKDYPEAKTIFPLTSDFLKNIYSYQYAAMLPALRGAFQKT